MKTDKEKKEYISDAYDAFIVRAEECNIGYIIHLMDKETIVTQDFCFLIDNFEREDIITLVDSVMEDEDDKYISYPIADKDLFRTMILQLFDEIVVFLE
jgi:hypothetical protein